MPDTAPQPESRHATAPGGVVRRCLPWLGYVGLALLVTWPAVSRLSTHLIGHPDVDVWNHVWGFWWFKRKLVDLGEVPLYTNLLAYPKGGRLYFIDPLNALLAVPIQLVVGLVPAFNLVVMGEVAFAGLTTYWLARLVGASRQGAFLAGVLVCASPVLRCELHNGITEVGNVGWLVLAMGAAHRAVNSVRARDAVLAGAAAAMAFFACWYYGLAAVGVAGVLALHRLIRARRARGDAVFRAIKASLLYLGTTAISAAPFWAAFLWTLQGEGSIIKRSPGLNTFLLYHNATDLLSFFVPGRYHSPDLWAAYGERFLHTTYLGYVGLLASMWAFRRREARPWLWVGGIFAILGLGPYLFVGGAFPTVGKYLIPLPFAILSHGIGLMAITHPARMVVVTIVCVGVAAGLGLDRLMARFPAYRHAVAVGFIGAALVELLIFSPGPFPLSVADATVGPGVRAVARDPVPGAVLDLPVQHLNTMRTSRYLYEQTVHHRPTPYVVNVRAQSTPWLHQSYIYQWIRALPGTSQLSSLQALKRVPTEKLRQSLQHDYVDAGYRYVVIHRSVLSPPFGAWPYRHLFDPVLGPPTATPDGLWVYRLPATGSVGGADSAREPGGR